jgi:hypothetical protein
MRKGTKSNDEELNDFVSFVNFDDLRESQTRSLHFATKFLDCPRTD